MGPEGARKKKTAPAKPQKTTVPQSIPANAAPSKQKPPSVEIEDVDEEDDSSERPRNPRNILEAADGSDDDVPPAAMAVDTDPEEEEDSIEILEAPGEDDEAELGLYKISM